MSILTVADLRVALRTLRRSPGLVLVAALSLGLGIGAVTTVYSWMQAVAIDPLPAVAESRDLVDVRERPSDGSPAPWAMSYRNLEYLRSSTRTLEGLTAFHMMRLNLRDSGRPVGVLGAVTTGDYFAVLGVRPALGRAFLPDEEEAAAPVAVISHSLWRSRFHGDSSVVGRRVTVNRQALTVVGVAPEGFGGTFVGVGIDLWTPVTLLPSLRPGTASWLRDHDSGFLIGVGRLRGGVGREQARAELDRLMRSQRSAHPDISSDGAVVERLGAHEPTRVFPMVFAFQLAIATLVLLVACANIANLLLERATVRRREIGVRLALGAGRGRLVGQLLAESLVLAAIGGAVGTAIAVWGRDLLWELTPDVGLPIVIDIPLDARVLAVTVAATVLAALAAGLAPALRASRPDLMASLRSDAGAVQSHGGRLRSALVAAQVALSAMALVPASLLGRSALNARDVDTGVRDPQDVLIADLDLPAAGYADSAAAALTARIIERVRAVRGVEDASVSSWLPLGLGGTQSLLVVPEGLPRTDEGRVMVQYAAVGPDHLRALGLRVVRGREIDARDVRGAPLVTVVNETFAARYWPGAEPLGKLVWWGETPLTVVGVAEDVVYNELGESARPFFYYAQLQAPTPWVTLVVRVGDDPMAVVPAVENAVASLDPDLLLLGPRTLQGHMRGTLFLREAAAGVTGGFGSLALILALVGVYGVMSYAVARRTREIGLRIALGAARRDVLALVTLQALQLAAPGLALGLLAGTAAAAAVRSQLFGIGPLDPVTLAVVAALVVATALLAAWLPARRAAGVDPMTALRCE